MHEHLAVGFPGWETDSRAPAKPFRELVAICVDRIEELKAAGFSTLLDPCPNDLGRDINLMAEVSSRTGFNIICATGLYYDGGGLSHWKVKFSLDPNAVGELSDMFIAELTEGIGSTGIKAGIIKLASEATITDYDLKVMQAGAVAAVATGMPITTHTGAVFGDKQLQVLTDLNVPAHRVIIGHSCGSNDHAYHKRITDAGGYIGFDRFGAWDLNSDENRVKSLLQIFRAGRGQQLIVSHDNVWCARGMEALYAKTEPQFGTLRFTRKIAPMLENAGLSPAEIDNLLRENPRNFFNG